MAKKAALVEPPPVLPATAQAAASSAALPAPKLDDLIWMRDKFASGLMNLETGVRELRLAYLNHFNSLLPENHPQRLDPTFLLVGQNAFGDSHMPSLNAGLSGGMVTGPGGATKRKRKPHDPNAPKRALTSYFLFMQSNKPGIKEAHPEWTAQQVSEESERRWANITDGEKKQYEYMYNVDLARYYKQKEEYDAGRPIPHIEPDEAKRLYDEHLRTGTLIKGRKGRKVLETAVAAGENVPASAAAAFTNVKPDESEEEEIDDPKVDAADADAEADEDDEDEESEEEAPPPKSKKAKTAKGNAKATPKRDSPAQKKARGKKGAADESENDLIEDTSDKKSAKKPAANRKRKSGKSE